MADLKTLTVNERNVINEIDDININLANGNFLSKSDDISDINDMHTNGWYWIDPGKHPNTPGNHWGTLLIINSNTQIFFSYNGISNPIHIIGRIDANGAWTPWAYPDGTLY